MEVQRTLVKSPPEIWAEVSDVEALARHLGEFGEIAITRVEPETKVAPTKLVVTVVGPVVGPAPTLRTVSA